MTDETIDKLAAALAAGKQVLVVFPTDQAAVNACRVATQRMLASGMNVEASVRNISMACKSPPQPWLRCSIRFKSIYERPFGHRERIIFDDSVYYLSPMSREKAELYQGLLREWRYCQAMNDKSTGGFLDEPHPTGNQPPLPACRTADVGSGGEEAGPC